MAAKLQASGRCGNAAAIREGGVKNAEPPQTERTFTLGTCRFKKELTGRGCPGLVKKRVEVLQVNLGKYCNMACSHCYAEASPARKRENMSRKTAEAVLRFLARSDIKKIDLTGGAPELNRNFRFLVKEAADHGIHVIDRCNLTVFDEPGGEALAEFLASFNVEVIASLPDPVGKISDRQRGAGAFDVSVKALKHLNELGYGKDGGGLCLNLVYNPVELILPPPQAELEAGYKRSLFENYGIVFNRLYAMTNMPITRFAERLKRLGKYEEYRELLIRNFDERNLESVMCRNTLAVGWDGRLYDCDFNQAIGKVIGGKKTGRIFGACAGEFEGRTILNGEHCFGCTAGAGSSCGGALRNEILHNASAS